MPAPPSAGWGLRVNTRLQPCGKGGVYVYARAALGAPMTTMAAPTPIQPPSPRRWMMLSDLYRLGAGGSPAGTAGCQAARGRWAVLRRRSRRQLQVWGNHHYVSRTRRVVRAGACPLGRRRRRRSCGRGQCAILIRGIAWVLVGIRGPPRGTAAGAATVPGDERAVAPAGGNVALGLGTERQGRGRREQHRNRGREALHVGTKPFCSMHHTLWNSCRRGKTPGGPS